jgi:Icc protein
MRQAGLPMDDTVIGNWHIVALDSHGDDSLPSAVDGRRVADLKSRFCGRHVLIATHHHLLPVDCPWLDNDRSVEPDLHDLLADSDTVRAVAFGHVHQLVDRELGRTRLLGTPSTCFQFAPRSAKFAVDEQAPGYRRIHLHDDGTVATTVHRTPPLAEPARIGSRTEQ